MFFFAIVFRVHGPAAGFFWGHVLYGSVISALLYTVGETLISFYLACTRKASTYWAAVSLVLFLIWVYYLSQIAFFGAELIQARCTRADWLLK